MSHDHDPDFTNPKMNGQGMSDEEKIVAEVGRIVTDLSNWPSPIDVHLLGRDLSGPIDKIAAALEPVIRDREANAWEAGVKTTLNHAIDNDDGVTLRLEHLDGRPWQNPYRAEGDA